MPWNHLYAPLDRTIDQLEWLAKHLPHFDARVTLIARQHLVADHHLAALLQRPAALRALENLR